jgi:protein-L-isoaspartate(D-aspartate) O-methyltransferase
MTQVDADADAVDEARRCYAEEIRFVANLQREEVVRAFSEVPRERFLGAPPWKVGSVVEGYRDVPGSDPRDTYHNVLFAIDPRRFLNNGLPSFVGKLIDESGAGPGHHVVHIGCGTGYYSAIFAQLVGEAGHVTAIEVDDDLVARARANLASWSRVDVKQADGTIFDAGAANAILVNAGATHLMPLWLERLLPGATLLVPLTVNAAVHGMGWMLKVTDTPQGLAARFISPVGIYHCVGARDEVMNRRLGQAFMRGNDLLAKVRSLRRDAHTEGDDCWLHADEFCISSLALGTA